jgi:hypothetical protein
MDRSEKSPQTSAQWWEEKLVEASTPVDTTRRHSHLTPKACRSIILARPKEVSGWR